MTKEIKMPNLGTTTNEMKIVSWHKAIGDYVKRGEVLFEVETDKAVMDVESYLEGYLKKIEVEEGGMVLTGSLVALIGNEDDVMGESEPKKEEREVAKDKPARAIDKKTDNVRISPIVKKIAQRLNVDYTKVEGSGENGTIMKADIENAAAKSVDNEERLEKFDRIAKATAKAMELSKSTIPHVYFTVEIDAQPMIDLREKSGKTVSYNTMIIKAVADSIKKYPYLSAKYSEDGRILADSINIGLATARDMDLFVPVIKNAGEASYSEIEEKIKELVAKVMEDKLDQNNISGGCFTVTNLGSYGIDSFSAVINPPEAAIMAIGKIEDRVAAQNRKMIIKPIMKITLSVDHRIINGAYAAEFLKVFKAALEGVE